MSKKDKIGYGKPPKKSQWKKGQSGNAKGRPKGIKNMETVIREEAYSKIVITEGGKSRKVTKVEALFKRMMAKGIQGDNKAAAIALGLMQEYLPEIDPGAAAKAPLSDEDQKILSNHVALLQLIQESTND